jgi:hypothetical protein
VKYSFATSEGTEYAAGQEAQGPQDTFQAAQCDEIL